MRILFYISKLANGGAERVTATLANELSQRGYDVHILLYKSDSKDYTLNDSITCHYFDKNTNDYYTSTRNNIISINPDIIIAMMYSNFFKVLQATRHLNIPIIASDHSSFKWNPTEKKKIIRYYYYNFADVVTVLSENDREFMKDTLHNMKVMYNPLSFPRLDHPTQRTKTILCAGSLQRWKIKGFDNMIKMWGKIAHKHPDWCLEIAGDGTDDDIMYLTNLVQKENVFDSVYFLGWCEDIDKIMQKSSIFALPSRTEGFPCVLLEAMSQGCVPVSFEIYGNIQEIITDGEDGFIVPNDDLDAFAEKLEELIDNEDLREQMGEKAITSMERFEMNKIVDKWEELLIDTVNKKKQS